MGLQIYRCITTWRCEEENGVEFVRTHVRAAVSREAAIAEERAHDEERLRHGMGAEGWHVAAVNAYLAQGELSDARCARQDMERGAS